MTDERGAGAVASTPATKPAGITDEAVERLRARIGVPEPHPQPPHYTRA